MKNHSLGFEVPNRSGSESRKYRPDFIVQVEDGGFCITPRKGSIQFRLLRKRLAGAPNPSVPV